MTLREMGISWPFSVTLRNKIDFMPPTLIVWGSYSYCPVHLSICLSAKTLTLAISFDR